MKTVLITGASRGIGESTAKVFAKEGYSIIINYKENDEAALKVKREIEKEYDVEVLLIKADVASEEEIKTMCQIIKNKYKLLSCVVNNAGIAIDNDYFSKTKDEFREVIDTNLIGTFLVMKYASLIMNKGVIINVSSDNALNQGYKESIDYDASKAGVIALSHDFAQSLAPNIRVNVVAPGWVLTDMNKDMEPSFKSKQMNKCLLKRMAEPEEIAQVIYFLASDRASYINDVVLPVNGGIENE